MTACVHASDPFFDDHLGRYTPTYNAPTRRQVQDTQIPFDAPTQTLTSQTHTHSHVPYNWNASLQYTTCGGGTIAPGYHHWIQRWDEDLWMSSWGHPSLQPDKWRWGQQ